MKIQKKYLLLFKINIWRIEFNWTAEHCDGPLLILVVYGQLVLLCLSAILFIL